MKKFCVNCLEVLGTKSRARLYLTLQKYGKSSVSELVKKTNLTQPTVSYHLIKLEKCGLLNHVKVGKKSMYQISDTCLYDKGVCIISGEK